MTIFQIVGVFIIGIIILGVGIAKKKKWVIFISVIPFLITLWQIIMLLGFAFH